MRIKRKRRRRKTIRGGGRESRKGVEDREERVIDGNYTGDGDGGLEGAGEGKMGRVKELKWKIWYSGGGEDPLKGI